MTKPKPNYSRARHFDIQKHWRKLGPIFKSKEAEKIWRPCMREFVENRLKEGFCTADRPHPTPASYENGDWRWYPPKRGRQPAYWDFVCSCSCHWIVDLCLYVATTAYPNVPWRILNSREHSTVWNGNLKSPVLFDVNFSAMGVSAKEGLKLAYKGRTLAPGRYLKPYRHVK